MRVKIIAVVTGEARLARNYEREGLSFLTLTSSSDLTFHSMGDPLGLVQSLGCLGSLGLSEEGGVKGGG